MTLPLQVREMLGTERTMVLANWKNDLFGHRKAHGWGRGLEDRDYWCLVNHVIDRITLPSSEVYVGCHEKDPMTPVCWVAVRRIVPLSVYEVVYLYARPELMKDPELAATLQRELLSKVPHLALERRSFNPFLELRR